MAQYRGRFDRPRPGMEKGANIINRLLDKGDLEAASWVLRHFSRELIAETLRTKRDFTFLAVNKFILKHDGLNLSGSPLGQSLPRIYLEPYPSRTGLGSSSRILE
jgi:hypothetical protein